MYYLFDSLCLYYRQEEHWKIEPISIEEREAEQAKQAEQVCDSLAQKSSSALCNLSWCIWIVVFLFNQLNFQECDPFE